MKRILIFSVIAIFSLIVAMVATIFAGKGRYQLYWVSVIGIFIFSYLYGFSIVQMTVILTLVPLTMVIRYSFGWIISRKH